jgi:hypothetical protein
MCNVTPGSKIVKMNSNSPRHCMYVVSYPFFVPGSYRIPIATPFCIAQGILKRHQHVVPTIAQGIVELKRARPEFGVIGTDNLDESPYLTDFLDRFYMARVGVRTLIEQHSALHNQSKGYVGIIDGHCNAHQVVQVVFQHV